MARNVILQLANSEGLMKVLVFTGLSHSLVVHPTIHGEPLLTAQAFYYLEELESVARLRYEAGEQVNGVRHRFEQMGSDTRVNKWGQTP